MGLKQNGNRFFVVVKGTALKHQISEFYPQNQRIDASDHIYVSQYMACKSWLLCVEFVNKILIFAVLKRLLLQLGETDSSFVYNILISDDDQSNWRFFYFLSEWRPRPSWIFKISKFLTVSSVKMGQQSTCVTILSIVAIGQKVPEIWRFFKMAADAVLDFYTF